MKILVTGFLLAVLVFSGLGVSIGLGVPAVLAASTFIGTTVVDVGPDGRAVTIRTNQGESLSLVVADPAMMKGVQKGDQVSLELGPDDRVSKIVKVGENSSPSPSKGKASESEY
jgi:hypothetical protein